MPKPRGARREAHRIARLRDGECLGQPVRSLGSDRPPQLLDQVKPVEQLDRGGKAPFADPADSDGPVRHEQDPLRVEYAEPGAGRGQALRKPHPAAGPADVRPAGQGAPRPADAKGAVEDEADLDLELGARTAVVNHHAVGTDPDGATPRRVAAAFGLIAEHRLGGCLGGQLEDLEAQAFGGHRLIQAGEPGRSVDGRRGAKGERRRKGDRTKPARELMCVIPRWRGSRVPARKSYDRSSGL